MEGKPNKQEEERPSESIQKIIDGIEYDWRDSCGAVNCECYENSVKLEAIVKYLDSLAENNLITPKP